MRIVPNGLDAFFKIEESPQPPPASPLLLTVSRLSRSDCYKGVDNLIEAMPAVLSRHPDARLRIVGHGNDSGRLRKLANSLRVGDSVDMLGHVSDDELKRSFSECSLFALPSRGEGFGLVFLEAMAHGKPCIGAKAGGIPEVITPETGLLVHYGDVPALANAIEHMLTTHWTPSAMLSRAREFSYPEFRTRLALELPRG